MNRFHNTSLRTEHLLRLAVSLLLCVLAVAFGAPQAGHTAERHASIERVSTVRTTNTGHSESSDEAPASEATTIDHGANRVVEQRSRFRNRPSLFSYTQGGQLGSFIKSNISEQATTAHSLQEYKRLGFSGIPTTPSSADSVTSLIDPRSYIALGDKTPVILIHGLHGGDSNDSSTYWGNLMWYLEFSTNFSTKYKFYLFTYKSDIYRVYDIAASLRNRIDDLVRQNSQLTSKQFVLIAHSMGGLVARSYMNQHNTDYGGQPFQGRRAGERIQKLITLATPHHGSQLMNGRARGGGDDWQSAYSDLDYSYWKWGNSCKDCASDLQHPNRADLLWDNFTHQWDNNSFYTGAPSEHNTLLPMGDSDHAYDGKIIAYYGVIGSNKKTNNLSKNSAKDLAWYIKSRGFWNSHLGANATGVLLQRIADNNFVVSNPLTIYNDGAVQDSSARFDRPDGARWPSVAARIRCSGYDHEDMKDGKSSNCDDGRPLLRSILYQLDPSLSPSSALNGQRVAAVTAAGHGLVSLSSPVNLGVVGFTPGVQGSGEDEEVTIYNLGESQAQVTSVSLGGANPDQFQLGNLPSMPLTLQPGGSTQLTIRFKPSSLGDKSATINVANDSVIPNATGVVTGFGLPTDCSITLSPASRYVPIGGGSGSFAVPTTSCSWSVSSDYTWIHPNVFGSTVSYSVDSNGSGELRFGKIDVNLSGIIYPFNIIQSGTYAGCRLNLSDNEKEIPSVGGVEAITVATQDNCGWSASSDSPWITLNTSGVRVGTQPLNYTVAANTGASIRFGTVTVQGQDATQVFTVSQDPATNTCTYTLSATEQELPADGGQNSFTISTGAGCRWQLSTPDRWLTFNSANNGFGTATISYAGAANPMAGIRLGDISVQGTGPTPFLLTVRQSAQPAVYPSISLPAANIQMGTALVNTTTYQGVMINNAGPGYLFLESITRTAGSADFDLLPFGQNQIIAPGGSTSVTIRLTPSSTGSRSATFSISSNDPNAPSASFTASGNGVTQLTGGIDFVWANKLNAPTATYESAFVTLGSSIYVLGGSTGYNHNYRYDPTLNTWTQLSDSPYGCIDGGAVVINNKIYMLGDPFINRVQIYDPATNSWSVGSKIPTVRSGFAYGAVGGKFYVIGGAINGNSDQTTVVEAYDPTTDSWSAKAGMPLPRTYAASAVVNGLIYVIGGDGTYGGNIGWPERDVQVFDPANNSWSRRESLSSRRDLATATVLNNKIYLTGGRDTNGILKEVDEFDPTRPDASNDFYNINWALRNPISVARELHAAGSVNGKLYVIGGTTSAFQNSTTQIEEGTLSASPRINLPVVSFNCGDVPLGNFCDRRIEVQNEGNALLTISRWGLSSGSGDFVAFAGPASIDAGQSVSLVVRFTPSLTGNKSATFSISSNDPSASTVSFTVSANAVPAPQTRGTWQSVGTIQFANPSQHPTHIVVANGRAYVTRGFAYLSVVNLSSNTVVGEIPFPAYPNASAQSVSVSGNRAYVLLANVSPAKVAVVNTDNNSVLSYVPVSGTQPIGLAAVGGRVYVPNNGPDTVSVIDTGTNTVVNTIPIAAGASWIAADSGHGRAYVVGNKPCGAVGGCVSVIDTTTDAVVSTVSIPTPYTTHAGIALSDIRAYYLTDATVEIIDLSSATHVASVAVPRFLNGGSVAVAGGYVFVGTGYVTGATVNVINASTNYIEGTIGITDPNNIAVDPATGLVYVLSQTNSSITVLRYVSPAFSVSTNSQSLAAAGGAATSFTTTVSSVDGFNGPVTLSCEGLPTGSSCQFRQNPVSVPAGGSASSTLTVSVPSGAIAGLYGVRVIGSGSNSGGGVRPIVMSSTFARPSAITDSTPFTDFQSLSLTVPTCDYALSSNGLSVGAGAGAGSVDLAATSGCAWAATSDSSWLGITSAANGSGGATVSFSVAANAGPARTGTLTIAGQAFTVTQAAAAYRVSGRVANSSGSSLPGVTVTLSGAAAATTSTDSQGNYSFTGLAAGGTYTVTPSLANYTFTPASRTFANLASDQSGDFSATKNAYTISGSVTDSGGTPLAGTTVTLSGSASSTTTADAQGNYSFPSVAAGGSYTVTPSKPFFTFAPASRSFNGLAAGQSGANFVGTLSRYTVSGRVALSGSGDPLAGATVAMTGGATGSATTDSQGNYSFAGVPGGAAVTITPSKANFTFAPAQQSVNVDGDRAGVNFAASPVPATVQFGQSDYQFSEGVGRAGMTITRSGNTSTAVTVSFQTVDDPAAVRCDDTINNHGAAYARCDYATTVDTVTFAAGETSKTVTVPIIDDSFVEGAETFQARLYNPQGTTLGTPSTATVTITDNDRAGQANPILSNDFFLRMQYLDFLSRDPEPDGFSSWLATLNNCPAGDLSCDRASVSANFFRSQEFQLKGLFVFKFYKVAFGRMPLYSEIIPDMSSVTGSTTAELIAKKGAFTSAFAQRQEFKGLYDQMTNQQFVDTLMGRYGLQSITTINPASPDDASAARVILTRADLVSQLTTGTLTRGQMVRAMADSNEVSAAEFNAAFVAMQYFGYLRRDPEPDGYNAWLRTINANPSDIRSMVNGFVNSTEYRLRFGQP